MCGSDFVTIGVQGNVAAQPFGTITAPDSLHTSIMISDAFEGITIIDGQPMLALSESNPAAGYVGPSLPSLYLNSNITSSLRSNIVFGPYTVTPPNGQTTSSYANILINAANRYPNNYFYYSVPSIPSGYLPTGLYNSNSFVSGILSATGGTVQFYNFGNYQAPGYRNPIPSYGFRR